MKTDKIAEVADILETAASSGKLPRLLKTVADFRSACHLLRILRDEGSALCFIDNGKEFFLKQGFKVQKEGINWRISA